MRNIENTLTTMSTVDLENELWELDSQGATDSDFRRSVFAELLRRGVPAPTGESLPKRAPRTDTVPEVLAFAEGVLGMTLQPWQRSMMLAGKPERVSTAPAGYRAQGYRPTMVTMDEAARLLEDGDL